LGAQSICFMAAATIILPSHNPRLGDNAGPRSHLGLHLGPLSTMGSRKALRRRPSALLPQYSIGAGMIEGSTASAAVMRVSPAGLYDYFKSS
jgi:hypothetical protein